MKQPQSARLAIAEPVKRRRLLRNRERPDPTLNWVRPAKQRDDTVLVECRHPSLPLAVL